MITVHQNQCMEFQKKTCEDYVKSLCDKNNIKWTILRLFNVYGPGQNINRADQGIVGIFINLIKNKDVIEITGSLDRFKDLIYIDDVVKAFILSLKKKVTIKFLMLVQEKNNNI